MWGGGLSKIGSHKVQFREKKKATHKQVPYGTEHGTAFYFLPSLFPPPPPPLAVLLSDPTCVKGCKAEGSSQQ